MDPIQSAVTGVPAHGHLRILCNAVMDPKLVQTEVSNSIPSGFEWKGVGG